MNDYALTYLKMTVDKNVSLKYYYFNNTKRLTMRAWYLIIKNEETNRKTYVRLGKSNNQLVTKLQKYLDVTKVNHSNNYKNEELVFEHCKEKDYYYDKLIKNLLFDDYQFYFDLFLTGIKPKGKTKLGINIY